ncbi:MAG: FtsQ-type POTRA domain-containing protein, partial [Bryobacteraceae bacterium]|nr:FtsQ-type POTRA domain-containing protein [Bryobacteraceae bacterium]
MVRSIALALSLGMLLCPAQTSRRKPAPPAKTTSAPAKTVVVDPSLPFPLETIRVTGNQQLAEAEIIRMSGLQPGQQVTRADFDAAQAKLLASGL